MYNRQDHATQCNSHQVSCVHIDIDWTLDFQNKIISGFVKHNLVLLEDDVSQVIFDSQHLDISTVTISFQNKEYNCDFSSCETKLGDKVSVDLPKSIQSKDSIFQVKFEYQAKYISDDIVSAIQWIPDVSATGEKYPFLFTQCFAIHARTLLPCFDTPSVKSTYAAVVRAPQWCTVLMSAINPTDLSVTLTKRNKSPKKLSAQNDPPGTFRFTQPVAIPSYLLALAAGKLTSVDLSPRVRVWSDPELLRSVAFEFADTETYLKAAEALAGPYVWTRFDMVCLPSSFPYGGTENPCMTFITPTLLTGDRSLVDVVAHEIAHSWTGNLVTNSSWNHFWLNEGMTTWLERKIISRCSHSQELYKLSAQCGYSLLKDDILRINSIKQYSYTQLLYELTDQDPDDVYSRVPYEKVSD